MGQKRVGAVLAAVCAAALTLGWAAAATAAPESALDEKTMSPKAKANRPEKTAAETAAKHPAPPKAIVLRFEHIPAESFMNTLRQLGRNEHLSKVLQNVPIALNEDANAVVVIAPPDIAALVMTIAKGLDQPNVFAERMRNMEREEQKARLKREEAKRQLAGPPPWAGNPPMPPRGQATPRRPEVRSAPGPAGGPGMSPFQKLHDPRAIRERGPTPPRGQATPRRPEVRSAPGPAGDPGMGPFQRLLDSRAIRELGLKEEQVGKIRETLERCRNRVREMMAQVREKAEGMSPQERAAYMRETPEQLRHTHEKLFNETRGRIMELLTPDQRERAEQMFRGAPVPEGQRPERKPGGDQPKPKKRGEEARPAKPR